MLIKVTLIGSSLLPLWCQLEAGSSWSWRSFCMVSKSRWVRTKAVAGAGAGGGVLAGRGGGTAAGPLQPAASTTTASRIGADGERRL